MDTPGATDTDPGQPLDLPMSSGVPMEMQDVQSPPPASTAPTPATPEACAAAMPGAEAGAEAAQAKPPRPPKLLPPPSGSAAAQSPATPSEASKSRRSSRAIKRKRFDDDIVDSNTLASSAQPPTLSGGMSSPMTPGPSSAPESSASGLHLGQGLGSQGKGNGKIIMSRSSTSLDLDPAVANSRAALKKKSSKKTKQRKREGAWKDLSRWKPTDDLALITAVQQTNDLIAVHRGIKFSCHFTLNEIQERWNALMYEPIISKLALQAIKNLVPEIVLAIQRKTLFSKQEHDILYTIKANTNPPPSLKDFEALLQDHPHVFHFARTARCLAHHWQSLKLYNLLPDQSVHPLPKTDANILNFMDAESNINDGELFEDKDENLDHELTAADRKNKKEIRHLEAEVAKWQVLVDKVRGENTLDFDNQTLAVLRGRLVRYLMRSKEITLGRTTKDQTVDVDLKLEGPAWKISRKQGVIKLRNSGEFYIANEGRRCMFIDGKPLRRGTKVRLCNNAVLEIAGLKFVFLINTDLIEAIRHEATKLYQNS